MNGRGPRISNGEEGSPPPCLRNGLRIGKRIRTFLGDTGKKPSAGLTFHASSPESGGTFCIFTRKPRAPPRFMAATVTRGVSSVEFSAYAVT